MKRKLKEKLRKKGQRKNNFEKRIFSFLRFSSFCGILFPLVCISLVGLFASFIKEYSHFQNYISELWAIGSMFENVSAFIMIFLSILIFVFGLGLYFLIKKRKGSKIVLFLFIVLFISFIGIGIFPCKPGCEYNQSQIHWLFTLIGFLSLTFSPIFFWYFTRNDENWKAYSYFNLIIQFIGIFLLIMQIFDIDLIKGFVQRAFLFTYLIWIEVIALEIFLFTKKHIKKTKKK